MPEIGINELAAASVRYQDALAKEAAAPGTSLIVYERGHGTSLAMCQAAERLGIQNMLLVMPKAFHELYAGQLDQYGKNVFLVAAGTGSMQAACKKAVEQASGGMCPTVFIAAPNQMSEAGHWQDAWPEKKPFGFVAVCDAGSFRTLRSEKGAGMKTMIKRAGNAVLLIDRDTPPEKIRSAEAMWGVKAVRLLPLHAPAAGSACEAMCMD